ncbi:Acetyltransferase [Marinobacterium lacunae]|uniref:Acetyltransferase n=1 Tax=Marinobacterium lacunae TaxID=1232683 RepID=A0A081FTT3_9GAMM|nr:GNAT family N-acetyltransferase [Marinobacterium lacunae]KEA61938.1 Acetyltransferase [Marinobacterium lacunae]MBR9884637.1 GNAT family N-acetyltransferase [Oceanospirillales bacterium]
MEIEQALKSDADDLAYLIDIAGEGMPQYLWSKLADPGQGALALGAQRAAREEGGFSYRNALVCRDRGNVLGMIIAYRLPAPYVVGDLNDYPEIVQPLIQLESKAPGSWYINAVATYEAARGQGVARMLMLEAQEKGRLAGCSLASLIVASGNKSARHLYKQLGYEDVASEPIIEYPGCPYGGDWLLMTKQLEG